MLKEKAHKQSLTVWVPKNVVKTADELAEFSGITRTKLLSNIIEANIGSLNNAKKIGYVHFILLIRNLIEKVKKPLINEEEIETQDIEDLQNIVDDLVQLRASESTSEKEKEEKWKKISEKIKNYIFE